LFNQLKTAEIFRIYNPYGDPRDLLPEHSEPSHYLLINRWNTS